MDSLPSKIDFSFSFLTSTVENADEWWQLMLKIDAEFYILVDGKKFFSEPDFPIVELAIQAYKWLQDSGRSFEYNSLESEENPVISFERISNNHI